MAKSSGEEMREEPSPPAESTGTGEGSAPSLHPLQSTLYLVHRARRVLLVVVLVVEAADAAHLIAIAVLVAGVVDVFFRRVFGDVLCNNPPPTSECLTKTARVAW